MITLYNEAYKTSYNILFDEAWQLLVDEGKITNDTEKFTSLEHYFTHIGDFAELYGNASISQDILQHNKYSKFLMLPLDEEYFLINANSRNISVPSNYSRNGVSVTGDQLAETLLFEVDRYFDYTDLATTKIYVQWTNPKGQNGATRITMIDLSKPNKIRFGWPLTSNITVENDNKTNGNLQFSIRFFIEEQTTDSLGDPKTVIKYSLNTLPATVSIKQALFTDLDKDIDIDDPALLFDAAIKNGIQTSTTPAAIPVLLKKENVYIPSKEKGYFYLDSNNAVILKAQATTSDTGNLSYQWKYTPRYIDESNTVIDGTQENVEAKSVYIISEDLIARNNKLYYVDAGEGNYTLLNVNNGDDLAAAAGENVQYYEAESQCQIIDDINPVTGTYEVYISNVTGANDDQVATITSGQYIIPCPEKITFEYGSDFKDYYEYEEGKTIRLAVIAKEQDPNATIAYEWIHENKDGEIQVIEGKTENTLTIDNADVGIYYTAVKASLNNQILTANSKTCKIVDPTKVPEFIAPMEDVTISADPNEAYELEVSVKVEKNELYSEGINFIWYKGVADEETAIDITGLISTEDSNAKYYQKDPIQETEDGEYKIYTMKLNVRVDKEYEAEYYQVKAFNVLNGINRESAKSAVFTLV